MKNNLKVKNIYYSDIIKNFSINVSESESAFLLCKDTESMPVLLSLLSGIIIPDRGSVLINGKKIHESLVNIGLLIDGESFRHICGSPDTDTVMCPIPHENITFSENIFKTLCCPGLHYLMMNHFIETYSVVSFRKTEQTGRLLRILFSLTDILLLGGPADVENDIYDPAFFKMINGVVKHEKKICLMTFLFDYYADLRYTDKIRMNQRKEVDI